MAEKTINKWFERVESYRSTDLSLKDWCKENNIVHSTMRSWVTKYNKANSANNNNNSETHKTNNWVSLNIPNNSLESSNSNPSIILEINSIKITLPSNFNPSDLKNIIRIIK